MSGDLWQEISAPVLEEVERWIEVLDRDTPSYARRVAEDLEQPGTAGRGPRPPAGMPPHLAAGIREQVRDHALMRRRKRGQQQARSVRDAGRAAALTIGRRS